MSELRLDPLTREWVAILADRQARPNLAPTGSDASECPFCVGGLEAPEPYTARAFENRWPPFTSGDPVDFSRATADATGFVSRPARGASEVVLYSPDHHDSLATIGVAGARRVVDLWAERTEELLARPEIAYVLVFENRGAIVGATIPHPHGQIYGFPFVPPVPRQEATVAAEHGCPVCDAVHDESREMDEDSPLTSVKPSSAPGLVTRFIIAPTPPTPSPGHPPLMAVVFVVLLMK